MKKMTKKTAIVALAVGAMCTACATQRTVEEHHHHHYEADTMAVQAQVDQKLQSWHYEMDSIWRSFENQYAAQWTASEHEQEIISELITETTDSLGRTVRQEQRTVKRDITRELQQQEQRLTRAYEQMLHTVADSISSEWHQRYDSLSRHVEQLDSLSSLSRQSSDTDSRPWYQRWFNNLRWLILGGLLTVVAGAIIIYKKR